MGIGSAVAGGLVNVAGSLVGNAIQNQQNKQAQQKAFENQRELMSDSDRYQRNYTKDQYGLQKEGLEASGYNPLIAMGSSATQEGGLQQSSPMGSAGGMANITGDMGSSINQSLAMDAQLDATRAQTEKTNAETEQIKTENGHRDTILGLTEASIMQSIEKMGSEVGVNDAKVDEIKSIIKNNQQTLNNLKNQNVLMEKGEGARKFGTNPTMGDILKTLGAENSKIVGPVVGAMSFLKAKKGISEATNFIKDIAKNYKNEKLIEDSIKKVFRG